jgi:hypothetical protein
MFGDSFGVGLQVPLEKIYSNQLEMRLNASADNAYEVINGSVGGWGTDQEVIFYATEAFRYRPDLVILSFFTGNDVLNNSETLELRHTYGERVKPFFHLGANGELIASQLPFKRPPSKKPTRSFLLPIEERLVSHFSWKPWGKAAS